MIFRKIFCLRTAFVLFCNGWLLSMTLAPFLLFSASAICIGCLHDAEEDQTNDQGTDKEKYGYCRCPSGICIVQSHNVHVTVVEVSFGPPT